MLLYIVNGQRYRLLYIVTGTYVLLEIFQLLLALPCDIGTPPMAIDDQRLIRQFLVPILMVMSYYGTKLMETT